MPRPTLVFVDGLPHLRITQMARMRNSELFWESADTKLWN